MREVQQLQGVVDRPGFQLGHRGQQRRQPPGVPVPPELAASRGRLEFRIGARRVMEQDTESWLGLRAERIAVFRRKLSRGGCRYRDIASAETVHAMAADGYTHIRSVPLPAGDDPGDKLERLAWAKEQLSNVRELMTSYPDGYELRFVPSDRIPASRLWSLVRKPGQQAEVLFTFTLTGQASGQVASPGGQGPWFAHGDAFLTGGPSWPRWPGPPSRRCRRPPSAR